MITKQIEFYPTDINVNELLGKIKNILDISAQNKNIRINIINEQEKLFAYADYDSVYTVIRNLTSNAIKFTHAGGNINLSAYKENRQIKIVVEDNGVGIPDAKLKTLFNPGQNKISVITSYSIHYTKLYEGSSAPRVRLGSTKSTSPTASSIH